MLAPKRTTLSHLSPLANLLLPVHSSFAKHGLLYRSDKVFVRIRENTQSPLCSRPLINDSGGVCVSRAIGNAGHYTCWHCPYLLFPSSALWVTKHRCLHFHVVTPYYGKTTIRSPRNLFFRLCGPGSSAFVHVI